MNLIKLRILIQVVELKKKTFVQVLDLFICIIITRLTSSSMISWIHQNRQTKTQAIPIRGHAILILTTNPYTYPARKQVINNKNNNITPYHLDA